jgi:hypothetical protein
MVHVIAFYKALCFVAVLFPRRRQPNTGNMFWGCSVFLSVGLMDAGRGCAVCLQMAVGVHPPPLVHGPWTCSPMIMMGPSTLGVQDCV